MRAYIFVMYDNQSRPPSYLYPDRSFLPLLIPCDNRSRPLSTPDPSLLIASLSYRQRLIRRPSSLPFPLRLLSSLPPRFYLHDPVNRKRPPSPLVTISSPLMNITERKETKRK
ncbi:hypothetical protein PGTUg99_027147 [Puccinia graminis f. sp. tritici]|uniref:Uncharacterized protein n=1 Tax=Puccinia graminis f. sp. tritici TaxID=56615 RepID=A0A5B0MTE1_PUCGR|nr:hypothetical protein PGTUg99_027147 [Puccinia graminis f. sp. tritici]